MTKAFAFCPEINWLINVNSLKQGMLFLVFQYPTDKNRDLKRLPCVCMSFHCA
jgi:hypothetical protein